MGDTLLSKKEARRVYVLEQLVAGKVTSDEAAIALGLSRRQVLRLKARFRSSGSGGLAHGNRGKPAAHAIEVSVRQRIIVLAQGEYKGASYAHMSELLSDEQGICVSAKSVGRILKQVGIDHAHSHRPPRKHRSRARMTQEGVLVLMDASRHAWLEGRGPTLSLHGAVDDATSGIVGLHFASQECTEGYLQVVWQMLGGHGSPARIYTDRHTLFVSPKQLSLEEELAGRTVALTQFGEVLAELQVDHLKARSPQAKGRIERLWGTLQERLVLEMRLAGIDTMEEANRYLPGFIKRHNQRFAVKPANPTRAWRPAPPYAQRQNVVAVRHQRTASHGSTISFIGKQWQLKDSHGQIVALSPGAKVDIRIRLDGSVRAFYRSEGHALVHFNAVQAVRPAEQPATKKTTATKPAADHPWRKSMPPFRNRERVTFPLS
jgi:transposase